MFGDFLRNYKSLNYSDLRYQEPGTPIVIKRSAHMYQFGIYGNNNVIFQHCFFIGSIIFFCIEECSAKNFAQMVNCMNIRHNMTLINHQLMPTQNIIIRSTK